MPLTLDTSVPPPDGPEDPPTPMSPLRSPTLFAVERPFTPKSSRFSFTEAEAGARTPAPVAEEEAEETSPAAGYLESVYSADGERGALGALAGHAGFEAPALSVEDDILPFHVGGGGDGELMMDDDEEAALQDQPWYALPFCNCTASF